MPFVIEHGPISAAMQLAQEAGRGQGLGMRQEVVSRALDRLDRRKAMALNLRQQQFSEALAYDKLKRDENVRQAEMAQRQAEMAAEQQWRDAQMKEATAQQLFRNDLLLEENRRAQEKMLADRQRQGTLDAFKQKELSQADRRLEQTDESLAISREKMNPSLKAYTSSPAHKAAQEQIKLQEDAISDLQNKLGSLTDKSPFGKMADQAQPAKGKEEEFESVLNQIAQRQAILQEIRDGEAQRLAQAQQTDAARMAGSTPGISPAAGGQPVMAPEEKQRREEIVKLTINGIASMILNQITEAELTQANDQKLADLALQAFSAYSTSKGVTVDPSNPDVRTIVFGIVAQLKQRNSGG